MKELTRRQKEVLDTIARFSHEKGYPPSMREITILMKLASAAGIHKHIKALQKKGFLAKEAFLSRSLRVLRGADPLPAAGAGKGAAPDLVELPLVGYVAAGLPIEAIEQRGETLAVPLSLLGRAGRRHFVLRVRGDSMVEESILDGDYVIVEERESAANGEVVVALLRGQEATLKRFYREDGEVRLQPANAAMAPLRVRGEELQLQGVVVGVWRRY
jgi:repressor LexA